MNLFEEVELVWCGKGVRDCVMLRNVEKSWGGR